MTLQYRQGDVLLTKIEEIPGGASFQRDERVVERGEVTGHVHRLEGMTEIHTRRFGEMFVRAWGDGARLVHEEHGPIALELGNYVVTRQREFEGEGERHVRD